MPLAQIILSGITVGAIHALVALDLSDLQGNTHHPFRTGR
jgi:hypothetical protein